MDPVEARDVLRLDKLRRATSARTSCSPSGSASRACRSSSSTAATALSGAQPAETMLTALERAWEEAVNLQA